MDDATTDDERVSRYLRALGVANRLRLLRALQVPKAVQEIRLPAARPTSHGSGERPISRQGLQKHLDTLAELGLVVSRQGERGGRNVTEYVVNHARLFVLTEELARLATIRPVAAAAHTAIRETTAAGTRLDVPEGPSLVVANGPLAGSMFPLEGEGPWTIGRDTQHAVALPYDPFVSRENARIEHRDRSWHLEALAGGRNGTRLNWDLLDQGARSPLCAGDAIGVGRSLLFVRGV